MCKKGSDCSMYFKSAGYADEEYKYLSIHNMEFAGISFFLFLKSYKMTDNNVEPHKIILLLPSTI